MSSIPYNARYLKLGGKVWQRDGSVQNEVRIDSFVASRSICVDTGKVFSKCFRADSLVYKLRRNTSLDHEGEVLCGTDLIGRGVINFPDSAKANIQFVEENTPIGNNILNASNFISHKMFNLLSIVKTRKTEQIPSLIWIQRWVNALSNQINDISQATCFHMRDVGNYLYWRLFAFWGYVHGFTAGELANV